MSQATATLPSSFVGSPHAGPAPIVAREGWTIIALFAAPTIGCGVAAAWLGGAVGVALWTLFGVLLAFTAWAIWFFRDPERSPAAGEDLSLCAICPADGVVVKIDRAAPPPDAVAAVGDSGSARTRLCVFMNVFNVHVNRTPFEGTVEKLAYHHGAFFNASFDKASDLNERASMVLRLADGSRAFVVQIAGLVARRIVCKVREGQSLRPGQRYGLIKFGSRVDLYLPEGYEPAVTKGQRVVAGETILARKPKNP